MQSPAGPGRDQRAAPPLAQLMDCPPTTASVLNAAAKHAEFSVGETIFRQGTRCEGLYVVMSGQLQRRAERMRTRLVLGSVHAGEIVELAAALGDGLHTYTLTAQSNGSLMILPIHALQEALEGYPPLRMQLLSELAREVSRAYVSCCSARTMGLRRRATGKIMTAGL